MQSLEGLLRGMFHGAAGNISTRDSTRRCHTRTAPKVRDTPVNNPGTNNISQRPRDHRQRKVILVSFARCLAATNELQSNHLQFAMRDMAFAPSDAAQCQAENVGDAGCCDTAADGEAGADPGDELFVLELA